MITCSNCGSNNHDGAVYCSSCGQKLAVQFYKQDKVESKISVAETDEEFKKIEEPSKKEEIDQKKPWYKKYLMAIVVLCSIVFFCAVAGNFNKSADYTMSAQQFAEEYSKNPRAADAKYNKKIVKLNGRVYGKGQFNSSSRIYLTLYSSYDVIEVLAGFDVDNKNAVNNAKQGDFITVQGEVDGIVPQSNSSVISIQLSNSEIIK